MAVEIITGGLLQGLAYDEFDNIIPEDGGKGKKKSKRPANEVFAKAYIFNNHMAASDKYEQLLNLQRLPEDIFAVAYHRRFVERTH